MKTLLAMLGTEKLFWVLFLIPHLGIWSIEGEKSCNAQLYIKRHSVQNVLAGDPFQLECPVRYCDNRPNVTWLKFTQGDYLPLEDKHRGHVSWEDKKNMSVFILYFNQSLTKDNGLYQCSGSVGSSVIKSHSITVYVTERTQNNSEHPLRNATSASRPPSKKEMEKRQLVLYSLLPLGGLPLLITGVYLLCCLRRHQGGKKKPSDTGERGINLVDVPQPFRSEQINMDTRQDSQILPLETTVYDNDPWVRLQEEPGIYSNQSLEENKEGIVYASLNHSIIEMNPRQSRNMKEAPTEYAAICVRS